jgi:hypothetical protein
MIKKMENKYILCVTQRRSVGPDNLAAREIAGWIESG